MPLLILPERSLLLIYSRHYLPIFIVLGVSQCYETGAIRNQAASRAGSMRANRTEQTLGILSAAGWNTGLATEKQMWRVEDDPLE